MLDIDYFVIARVPPKSKMTFHPFGTDIIEYSVDSTCCPEVLFG